MTDGRRFALFSHVPCRSDQDGGMFSDIPPHSREPRLWGARTDGPVHKCFLRHRLTIPFVLIYRPSVPWSLGLANRERLTFSTLFIVGARGRLFGHTPARRSQVADRNVRIDS